ncbi:hypothetical protein [Spirosoma agri]|nr:hypothetical protein [Spirosoma agri]
MKRPLRWPGDPSNDLLLKPGRSVAVHDTIIGLFINQFFFADKRN